MSPEKKSIKHCLVDVQNIESSLRFWKWDLQKGMIYLGVNVDVQKLQGQKTYRHPLQFMVLLFMDLYAGRVFVTLPSQSQIKLMYTQSVAPSFTIVHLVFVYLRSWKREISSKKRLLGESGWGGQVEVQLGNRCADAGMRQDEAPCVVVLES